jgi:hypothetical protein
MTSGAGPDRPHGGMATGRAGTAEAGAGADRSRGGVFSRAGADTLEAGACAPGRGAAA